MALSLVTLLHDVQVQLSTTPLIADGQCRQLDLFAVLPLQKNHVTPVRSVGPREGLDEQGGMGLGGLRDGLDAQGGYGISGVQRRFEWIKWLWDWWAPERV
jgi:hypothetical protein